MGIRSIERRLAPELCYEAVAEAVHAYVEASRKAGHLLWPHEHLVVPIMRAGYHPPGLLGVDNFIFRHQMISRAERKHAVAEARELSLPDEGELIEEIMWPYPTARLRARRRRESNRSFEQRQAEEWRREDATKCKTMQRKTAEDQTPTDEGAIADLAVRHDPESPRENATKCNTLQQNAALSDPAATASGARRERVLPREVAHHLEEMRKRMHFEPSGDGSYRLTIDPSPESVQARGASIAEVSPGPRSALQRLGALLAQTVQSPEFLDNARLDVEIWSESLRSEDLAKILATGRAALHDALEEIIHDAVGTGEYNDTVDPAGLADLLMGVNTGLEVNKLLAPPLLGEIDRPVPAK